MPRNNYGFIRTEYSFTSGSGELESGRYINEFKIRIFFDEFRELGEEHREDSMEIGRAKVSLFLVELGMDNEHSKFEVFDHCREFVNLYEELFNEHEEFIKPIQGSFDGLNYNLLYISQMELLPEWRSRGIGKKVLKDIIWRFSGCCGMIVLKAFPLQLSPGILESTNLWDQQLLFSSLTRNARLAQQKLNAFYKSVGFSRVPKSDLHYLSPSRGNPNLDQIPLDEEEKL
jgi:GNAT superfamily N-acetyltransferase